MRRGSTAAETNTRPRPWPRAMFTASTSAVAPSYSDAFETSSPVSSQTIDWNSNRVCSTPCESSGW